MQAYIAAAFAVSIVTVSIAQTNVPVPLVVGTKTVEVRKVTRVEPDGVTIMHAAGLTKYSFAELPAEWQQRYGYDPKKATAYSTSTAAARSRFVSAQQAARVRQVENAQRDGVIQSALMEIAGVVLQAKEDGGLLLKDVVSIEEIEVRDDRVVGVIKMNKKKVPVHLADRVYVTGFSGYTDGEAFAERVLPDGTYSYTTVLGAESTVRKFCAPPASYP